MTRDERDRLWEGCPKCGFMGDRRFLFVRRSFGEDDMAQRQQIQALREANARLTRMLINLRAENEALRLTRQTQRTEPLSVTVLDY